MEIDPRSRLFLERNAPRRIDAFGSCEDIRQMHLKMLACCRVDEHELKLLSKTLGNQHFSSGQSEEICREVCP